MLFRSARKMDAYLHRRISLTALTHWAELAMMEGQFDEHDLDAIRDVVARLGLYWINANLAPGENS